MKYWLVNRSWESFKRTQEFCGFISETERDKIIVGDKIVYFGNGIVLGVFEAIALPNFEFKCWQKNYPFQVKLKLLSISKRGLLAKPLESKILMQKSQGQSQNLVELTEKEFHQIKDVIDANEKELIFK